MGAAEDPVNSTAGALGSLENHTTVPTGNPINDRASSSENAVKDEAPSAVNSNDLLDGTVNIKNHQAAGAENLVNDQVGGSVNPASEKAVNPVSEQVANAENLVHKQAGGAENLASDQTGIAENLQNNLAGGGLEDHLNNEVADGSVNPANIQTAEGSENPAKIQAAEGSENPANNQAAVVADISVDNKAGTAENPVTDEVCASDIAMNDKTGGVEMLVNNSADRVESLAEDEADAVETPGSSKEHCLPEEAKELLKSLASKWEDVVDANALQVIPLKGAMTNQVFQIKWATTAGETSRKVLVRIYGEGVEIFFNRDHEINTFEFMSKNGQGPRLLGRFSNGRVEEFIHARTLSASDLRDPSITGLIAAKMKEFHDLDMPGEKEVHLWDTLRNWLSDAKRLSSPKEVEAFYLDTIDKEISILEKELSGPHQRIGFCHNDLQYGNIMLDEETNSVTIIDYEYASYNPIAYDIANHFCEMAANYHTEEPHVLNYNKYPDFEERQRFVEAYLSTAGEQPSENEVEQLLQEIEKYTLANHLFWGIWGIISAQVNTIDFDYKEYAKQRFQEYWARKPYLLISSDAPSPYNAPEGTGELASPLPAKSSKNSGMLRKMKRVLGLGLFKSKS